MPSERFNLVFSGDLARGADLAQAKKNLGRLFKISDEKVEALFSGKAITLKKNLDFATANKYRTAIKNAGCRADLVEESTAEVASQPGDSSSQPNDSLSQNGQALSDERQSNAELVPAEPEPEHASAESDSLGHHDDDTPPLPQVEELEASESSDFNLGTKLSLSLAPNSGNLVDIHELDHPEPLDIDVSNMTVKEAGADLLDDSEKDVFVEANIDLDVDLAPVGSDLLRAEEKEVLEIPVIDVSELDIADVGEDLGQLKERVDAVAPDTSHLSLK